MKKNRQTKPHLNDFEKSYIVANSDWHIKLDS